jgi:hypothetical protein
MNEVNSIDIKELENNKVNRVPESFTFRNFFQKIKIIFLSFFYDFILDVKKKYTILYLIFNNYFCRILESFKILFAHLIFIITILDIFTHRGLLFSIIQNQKQLYCVEKELKTMKKECMFLENSKIALQKNEQDVIEEFSIIMHGKALKERKFVYLKDS